MTDARNPGTPLAELTGFSEVVALASGGNASVYRARQAGFDRVVAVKLLRSAVHDPDSRRRFAREQALTGRLTGHPHIARIYDSGITSTGFPYLVMEYYRGGSVADRFATTGPTPLEDVLSTAIKLCGALATSHRAGILHRDVKPGNVLIDAFQEPVLADFGIADLTQLGPNMSVAMTNTFAAPEVLEEHGSPSEASDQYSLALTLRAMLLAGNPWESVAERRMRPLPAGVPAPVQASLDRALASRPTDRYPSVQAMGEALQGVQQALTLPETPMRILDLDENLQPAPFEDSAPMDHASESSTPEPADPTGYQAVARGVAEDEPNAAAKRSFRTPLIWGVAGLVTAGVIVGVAAAVLADRDSGSGQPDADPDPEVVAVADLAVTQPSPTSAKLTWTDPNNPPLPHVAVVLPITDGQWGEPDFAGGGEEIPAGTNSYLWAGLSRGQAACFYVANAVTFAPQSNIACINGAQPPQD